MALKVSLFQRCFPVAILLLLCALTAPASADRSFDIDPNPSPEAYTSLICPNDNPLDCYPALFQPTIHFQKIRPNQTLPPGLHVRLNLQTGEKEARLNVPEESERDRSEAILVIDNPPRTNDEDPNINVNTPLITHNLPQSPETALGVVEEEEKIPLHLRLQDASKQAEHARPYTPPRPAAPVDANEANLYEATVFIVKEKSLAKVEDDIIYDGDFADALETLTDLAHSMGWGLIICRDAELTTLLLRLIIAEEVYAESELRSAALLLLSTAVQNNPDALRALMDNCDTFGGAQGLTLKIVEMIDAERILFMHDEKEIYVKTVARQIFFLSQLCAHQDMMELYPLAFDDESVEAFPLFWRIFSAPHVKEAGRGIAKFKHRIANLVEDHVERYAAFQRARFAEEDDLGAQQSVYLSLQPWCKTFHSEIRAHNNEEPSGVLQAKQEVSRVLLMYTGEGCTLTDNSTNYDLRRREFEDSKLLL